MSHGCLPHDSMSLEKMNGSKASVMMRLCLVALAVLTPATALCCTPVVTFHRKSGKGSFSNFF